MIKAGVVGYGGLGHVHANGLHRVPDVQIVAVCDKRPEQLTAKEVAINVQTGGGDFDVSTARTYTDYRAMLAKESLDVMVLALPTDLHAEYAILAMEAGCHAFGEKPMALTTAQCDRMIAARDRTGRQLQIAQCLRFWPEYIALREAIETGTYGRLLSLTMERIGAYAGWASENWFNDHRRSGGAIHDLHLHDVDWAFHALGKPTSLVAAGRVGHTGGIDDVTALWDYADGPRVTMRASWMYTGFTMNYRAMFEKAVFDFGIPPEPDLHIFDHATKIRTKVALEPANAYQRELEYFLDCVRGKHRNTRCTAESTRDSVRLVELERESIAKQKRLKPTGLLSRRRDTPWK